MWSYFRSPAVPVCVPRMIYHSSLRYIRSGFKRVSLGRKTQETSRAGRVALFCISQKNRDFGRLSGTLLKRGAKVALSEGEGEVVYSGTWRVKDGAIQVDYRLIGMYKVIPRAGEEPPLVPGPVQHQEIRSDSQSPTRIEFDGTKFEATSALSASELKSRLQVYASTDAGKHPCPK